MTNFDPVTIANKLDRMIDRLDRLKVYEQYTLEQYLTNTDVQIIVERLLELVIQAALDINKALLKQVARKSIERNFESFIEMGESGFIPVELARKIAPSGPFRNVLAHDYDDIIDEEVFLAFRNALEQYPDYIEAIQNYLDSLDIDNDEPS
ncbi:MAG: DUF86 domain-containing protein [Phormidium sp.]